ncbi:MAG: Cof-type HAD-IIB family hydrolase [Eubacteriales bacterium]|nr:Cof-type HAD-IIB family hydrolase [Eubacteriales bacterium]
MTEPIMLVTDLDGTLLDSQKAIPAENLRAIEAFVRQGGLFTVATGRTEDTCQLATALLPVNAPAILYNGAAIVDLSSGTVLYSRTLNAAAYRPMLKRLMEQFPDVCVEIFAFGPLLLVNPSAVMDPYILREKQPYRMAALEDTPEEWLKMMLSAPHERLLEVQAFLESERPTLPECTMFFSADYYYEIVDAACSKGACVSFLAQALQVPMERIVAVGDHLNDLEMLRRCGYSYAPANAHPDAKNAAMVLSRTNDEGAVAEALARAWGKDVTETLL